MWELLNGETVVFKEQNHYVTDVYVSPFGSLWVELTTRYGYKSKLPLASVWSLMPNLAHIMMHHTMQFDMMAD
jgi:hypothetical protein